MQTMQASLAILETRLNDMLIPMKSAIDTSTALTDELNEKLKIHLNPLIQADLKTVIEKVNTDNKVMNQQLEDKLITAINNLNQLKQDVRIAEDSKQLITDATGAEMRNSQAKVEYLNTQLEAQKHEIAFEKNQADQRYASTQSQIALASAQTSSSTSGSSGKRTNEPLVTHKLFINKTPLDGTETHDVFDEWYADMADDFELLMPGSKVIMMAAEKSKEVCTTDWMMKQDNPGLACATSRELYSVLKKKTNLRAKNQVKALGENQGLEAWRLIRTNLSRKDNQRLQNEFDTLTTLQKMKIEDFSNFSTLQTRWESELHRFATIDHEYALGKFQQRNILYRALPQEIQIDLDKEQSRDESLSQYDEMVKFLTNLSRTQRFQKTSTPKPFSANLVDDVEPSKFVSQAEATPSNKASGEGEIYAVQDWAIFLNSDEGRHFISQGNQLPSEAQEALYSLMKGKGKGDKGKGKGKGYGGYGKGYGWNPDKGKGKGKGWESDKGKGKGKGFSPKG